MGSKVGEKLEVHCVADSRCRWIIQGFHSKAFAKTQCVKNAPIVLFSVGQNRVVSK
jgi:hypothetical protein